MSLSSHHSPGDLYFMPVLGHLHVILFCWVAVFETVSLEASGVAISVEDYKHNGGIDLCEVQTTHTGNTAYQYK